VKSLRRFFRALALQESVRSGERRRRGFASVNFHRTEVCAARAVATPEPRLEKSPEENRRMKISRRLTEIIAIQLLLGTATACGNGGAPGGATLAPRPAIVVDGSSTVYRITVAARAAFVKAAPEMVVVVDYHGTGGGFSRYLQGEVDIVDASRAAKPDEESKAKAQGIEWTQFLVGYDGITLVVHPRNDFVKSLSVAQLKAIWAPDAKAKTWKDVDPAWPDRKIILYSPDNDSGTFEFFTEAIVGSARHQRDDVQQSSDDNTLVIGVAGDRDGLGYFGYAYYAANQDKLRAVAIQNGEGAAPVLPSPATIIDKTYVPLSRPLFIYVKNSASRRPEVGQFLKHYLDNIDEFAVAGGYAPPTAADKSTNQEALSKLVVPGGKGEESKAPIPGAE
jgi:phosphate transport system substrate-binding protein